MLRVLRVLRVLLRMLRVLRLLTSASQQVRRAHADVTKQSLVVFPRQYDCENQIDFSSTIVHLYVRVAQKVRRGLGRAGRTGGAQRGVAACSLSATASLPSFPALATRPWRFAGSLRPWSRSAASRRRPRIPEGCAGGLWGGTGWGVRGLRAVCARSAVCARAGLGAVLTGRPSCDLVRDCATAAGVGG